MATKPAAALHATETQPLDALRPHPKNYREHPETQTAHLVASMREHGVYRNVVIASDGTILAGHGVVQAAIAAGLTEIPVVRLPLDPDDPRALKILAGDNEVGRLAENDNAVLLAILGEVAADDAAALLGTGHDDTSLATLLRLVEATGEHVDPMDEWAGMPDFVQQERGSVFHVTVHFASEEDADRFFGLIGIDRRARTWWPETDGLVGSTLSEVWVGAE